MKKKEKVSKPQEDLRIPTTPEALARAVFNTPKNTAHRASAARSRKVPARKAG